MKPAVLVSTCLAISLAVPDTAAMSDLTNLPPIIVADTQLNLALIDLITLRPELDGTGLARLNHSLMRLKRVVSLLREIDPELPDITVHDPSPH